MAYGTTANMVDVLGQVRGIVMTRLEQLHKTIQEYAEQQNILTQIQMHAEQEIAQLESVLKTVDQAGDYDTDPNVSRQQVQVQKKSIIPGGAAPMSPVGISYPYQHPGTEQIHSYEG